MCKKPNPHSLNVYQIYYQVIYIICNMLYDVILDTYWPVHNALFRNKMLSHRMHPPPYEKGKSEKEALGAKFQDLREVVYFWVHISAVAFLCDFVFRVECSFYVL